MYEFLICCIFLIPIVVLVTTIEYSNQKRKKVSFKNYLKLQKECKDILKFLSDKENKGFRQTNEYNKELIKIVKEEIKFKNIFLHFDNNGITKLYISRKGS